ncbi:MAG: translation initiation factor IF-2 subunit beta [Nanoarchaeota archaeon]
MDEYESLLDRAKSLLPEDASTHERFVIPKVKGHIEGAKTLVSNFEAICQVLSRNPKHVLKYILKEMATPGDLVGKGVVFKSKVSATRLNEKLQQYADEFVICKECSRPDTKLKKEGFAYFISCQACGAKHSVYAKI